METRDEAIDSITGPVASRLHGLATLLASGYSARVTEQPTPPTLGPVLKQDRKTRGLALDQLSQASGVSRSMLLQIERGEANPTLWNVAQALKLELNDLVGPRSTTAGDGWILVVSSRLLRLRR